MKNINDFPLSFNETLSPKGRPYRLSSIEKGTNYNWIYRFKYLDDNTFFAFITNSNGTILKKTK